MKFKNASQRKAVMAKLSQFGISRNRQFDMGDMVRYADAPVGSRSTKKPLGQVRDSMTREKGRVNLYLWGNKIATYQPKRYRLTVSDADYMTKTTKDRLNRVIPWGKIIQKQGQWYYETPRGQKIEFNDRMTFEMNKKYGKRSRQRRLSPKEEKSTFWWMIKNWTKEANK